MIIRPNLTGDGGTVLVLREGEGGGSGNPTPTPTPAPNWTEGLEPALIGHAQNRGWDKLDPAKAAAEALKAHREAETYIGVPADRILKLPADPNDSDGWNTVYQRLGAPKEATEYDEGIKSVKFADGSETDDRFVDTVRGLATQHHWTKEEAAAVAKTLVKFVDDGTKRDDEQYQVDLALEKKALVDNWGAPNVETNLVIARNAAAKLGVDPEAVQALEGVVGYAKVMSMFHQIGTKIGEDAFVRQTNPNGDPSLTKEQAAARLDELKRDEDWTKRLMAGDVQTNREFENLTRIMTQ